MEASNRDIEINISMLKNYFLNEIKLFLSDLYFLVMWRLHRKS